MLGKVKPCIASLALVCVDACGSCGIGCKTLDSVCKQWWSCRAGQRLPVVRYVVKLFIGTVDLLIGVLTIHQEYACSPPTIVS